ncbi:hypothetical protein [Brevibacterium moorei]|uniref:hypothetical protein n=1 Tax=Brevibacterium moorei TaxID=2968457 RepID=UPI00211C26FA|nr:hypothetical protein [Brevibacterium sp. 68QC2CO]MCQ9384425.1 hypothetical protein [Brevibacterium sp. 68QC2CO]
MTAKLTAADLKTALNTIQSKDFAGYTLSMHEGEVVSLMTLAYVLEVTPQKIAATAKRLGLEVFAPHGHQNKEANFKAVKVESINAL